MRQEPWVAAYLRCSLIWILILVCSFSVLHIAYYILVLIFWIWSFFGYFYDKPEWSQIRPFTGARYPIK